MTLKISVAFFVALSITSPLLSQQSNLDPADQKLFSDIYDQFINKQPKTTKVFVNGKVEYRERYLSRLTFDSLFKPIFGKVMLGNSDIVNQGSAYALAVSQFESQFTINFNWPVRKNTLGKYFNVGFAASSSSKVLPIFSKDQWQQGFSLSFGYTKSTTKSLFYSFDRKDFDLKKVRAVNLFLKETHELLLNDKSLTAQSAATENAPMSRDERIKAIASLEIKSNKDYDGIKEKIDRVKTIRKIGSSSDLLQKYVDSCLSLFEIKYFQKIGYSFWWHNTIIRPEYKGMSIYDTTAAKLVGIEKKHYFRLGIEHYRYYARNIKNLFLVQAGLGIKNTNGLEGKKPEDLSFLQVAVGDSTAISKNGEALAINDYEQYKKFVLLISPVAGFNWFWGEKKMFGMETFVSAKLGVKQKGSPFKDSISGRIGPLISLSGKSDMAKSTFGLLAQWEDVPFKDGQLSDGFSFNVRIGIPFNY
jgi:hypothetical protein